MPCSMMSPLSKCGPGVKLIFKWDYTMNEEGMTGKSEPGSSDNSCRMSICRTHRRCCGIIRMIFPGEEKQIDRDYYIPRVWNGGLGI